MRQELVETLFALKELSGGDFREARNAWWRDSKSKGSTPPAKKPSHVPPKPVVKNELDSFRRLTLKGKENVEQVDTPEGLYIFTGYLGGYPWAIAFKGKASKPVFVDQFYNESERQKKIEDTIAKYEFHIKSKKERALARSAATKNFKHDYKTGDVLYIAYGYGQKNVAFYEVVSVPSDRTVVVRAIGKRVVKDMREYQTVEPVRGKYSGKPIKVRVSLKGVKIDGYFAGEWDGQPKLQTTPGFGH